MFAKSYRTDVNKLTLEQYVAVVITRALPNAQGLIDAPRFIDDTDILTGWYFDPSGDARIYQINTQTARLIAC